MNTNKIRELAKIANENNLESIELHIDNMMIKIKVARGCLAEAERSGPVKIMHDTNVITKSDISIEAAPANEPALHEVKSPMVGVFYAAPAPDKEPYVRVGSKVKKGDVLCIIESMKLMNEITSDRDGEIAKICVENGQVVEFAQPLFKII